MVLIVLHQMFLRNIGEWLLFVTHEPSPWDRSIKDVIRINAESLQRLG